MIDGDGMEYRQKKADKEMYDFMEFMRKMDSISKRPKRCSCGSCCKED